MSTRGVAGQEDGVSKQRRFVQPRRVFTSCRLVIQVLGARRGSIVPYAEERSTERRRGTVSSRVRFWIKDGFALGRSLEKDIRPIDSGIPPLFLAGLV